jgi:phage shock protein E
MSNQSVKIIIITLISITMFGLFKSLLGNSDNEAVKTAIQEGALLVDVRTPLEFASGSVPEVAIEAHKLNRY